jgi:N-acetylneuraminic acid mutarotase
VALLAGEIVVVGGFEGTPRPLDSVAAYDPASNRWRALPSLPQALHHPNVAVVDGRLYVTGALTDDSFTATGVVLVFDPATGDWVFRRPMPAGSERGGGAVAVIGGRIHLAGGLRGNVATADFSAYDPVADRWDALPPLAQARDHLVAVASAGRFMALGGRSGTALRGSVEIFDPATGAWTLGAPMPTARGGCMGDAVGGLVVVVGGEGNAAAASGVFAQAEAFDPATNRWATLPAMPTPRHGSAAVAIGRTLYVPGGASADGFAASDVFEALTI